MLLHCAPSTAYKDIWQQFQSKMNPIFWDPKLRAQVGSVPAMPHLREIGIGSPAQRRAHCFGEEQLVELPLATNSGTAGNPTNREMKIMPTLPHRELGLPVHGTTFPILGQQAVTTNRRDIWWNMVECPVTQQAPTLP